MSINHGVVWWSELMTRDVEKAVAWYREVCGWSIEPMPMERGTYFVAVAHGKPVAGIMDMSGMEHLAEVPPHWFTYFAVDDVERAMEQTRATGGEVMRPPFDVPGVGRIGIVKDPTGAALGFMKPVFEGDSLVDADRDMEEEEVEADNFPI
ncbi:VOC family protein [Aliiruegeria lutimaris]|uniref:VOC domain-containing protein n=1 Tax=Aliiruegeria lutimaris TaxID=571298 RepID=A0A1G9H055_9RHOB|nr:VOC family protein [Aliiruegeria lutimaris]SDL06251.1 hypothetical protein SAMN04488026_10663 [Aliiruegeria lutimaris]